jgi:hypothetical protein
MGIEFNGGELVRFNPLHTIDVRLHDEFETVFEQLDQYGMESKHKQYLNRFFRWIQILLVQDGNVAFVGNDLVSIDEMHAEENSDGIEGIGDVSFDALLYQFEGFLENFHEEFRCCPILHHEKVADE